MARKEVVMITCDRCKREELQPSNGDKKVINDFECQVLGQTLAYLDLCGRCKACVVRHFEFIKEWERDIKSLLGPAVAHNEAPPITSAPDYSPPKPHSR